jgi:5'-nucleotidase
LKILLTNDDSINAAGLKKLKTCLENFGKVVVVAPDRERSGSGCSASIYQMLRCRKIWSGQDLYGYELSGTPVDCVMIALDKIFGNEKPDLVISGINAGANLGKDIFYSGTVGAAIEGAFHDIFSIAVSIDQKEDPLYSSAIKVMEKIMPTLPAKNYRQPKVLNINIPNIPYSEIKGIKLTKLAHVFHQKFIRSIYKSNHLEYFWIEGSQPEGIMENNSDYWAIRNHYISITDVSFELKHNPSQNHLKKWIDSLNL